MYNLSSGDEYFMKKVLSAFICLLLLVLSSISAFAEVKDTDSSTGINIFDATYPIRNLEDITIPDNTVNFYCYGNNIDPEVSMTFTDEVTLEKKTLGFTSGKVNSINLPSKNDYDLFLRYTNGGQSCTGNNYNHTGGEYEMVRIRPAKFIEGLNNNGTYTYVYDNGITHTYNFTMESYEYNSILVIVSGAAINVVAPDQYGMVNIVVSKKIGEVTYCSDRFEIETVDGFSCSSSELEYYLKGITMGDVDKDGYVDIYDATFMQKYCIGLEQLDMITERCADVNGDGRYNILDATEIQKALAGI